MKKTWQRVVSSALALSMMASVVPPAALAVSGSISIGSDISSSTEEKLSGDGQLVITNGFPDISHASSVMDSSVYYGTNWSYDQSSSTLTLLNNEEAPWVFKDLDCNLVVGTNESRAWVTGGLFSGNVQVVNGSIDGVFLSKFTNQPGNDCSSGYMVFRNAPSGVNYSLVSTSDSNLNNVRVGLDPDYTLSCYSDSVYITSGINHYFMLMGLTKDALYDINGYSLDLHENTADESEKSDSFFGSFLSSTLVDVLKDGNGNKVAKVYYLSASAASAFSDGALNEELFFVFPLDDASREYELNAQLYSDPHGVEIVNGYPDLSRATRQEGSVYYGTGWSYDTSSQTLYLTENTQDSHGITEEVVLGSKDSPMLCKVVVGTSDAPFYVNGGYFANDVTLVNGQIYRGVFDESAHFTNSIDKEDPEGQSVGYCVFVNEPTDDVVKYSKITTNDAALAAKMETCMNPAYTADYMLPGGTVFGSAGAMHMFAIFGLDKDDLTDINGQELKLVPSEANEQLLSCNLTDDSGNYGAVMFAPAEMASSAFGVDRDLFLIVPMDDEARTFELNQRTPIEDPTKLPKDENDNIVVKPSQTIQLPADSDKIEKEVQNAGTIASGNFSSVTGGTIAGGTIEEAKNVQTISGGTVAHVAGVQEITGGVIGAESDIPESILEAKKPAVLKLVDEQGEALLDASVNNVIVPQGGTLSMENSIAADDVQPVAYIFDGTNVTVRYTGSRKFERWTVDGIDASDVDFHGETASFSLDNVAGQTVTFAAHTTEATPVEVTYTIKVEDGLINGKTSATVKAGDTVSLTAGEAPDGMTFQYWDIPTELLQALIGQDSTFDNKVKDLSFTMPDLSAVEDKNFTIRAAFVNTEIAEDPAPGSAVLSTATAVVAGGTAATVLGWQLYNVGAELYLKAILPEGAAIPANRQELALLLWQNAGKPDVTAAPYADVADAESDIQKATRWAVSNGLLDAKGNDSFAPTEKVSKWTVIQSWKKAQKLSAQ